MEIEWDGRLGGGRQGGEGSGKWLEEDRCQFPCWRHISGTGWRIKMPKGQGCASDPVTLGTSMVVTRHRWDAYQDSQIYRLQLRSWWGNRRGFNSKAGSFKIG